MYNLKIANDELKWEKETVIGLDLDKLKEGYASLVNLHTDETDYWASVEFKDVKDNSENPTVSVLELSEVDK